MCSWVATPRPATGVSRALRARSVPGVFLGVSLRPFGPRAPEWPKVSPECPGHLFDTPGTLSGHFWPLRSPGPEGSQRHPEEHTRDTSGPKGLRDSCSRPGGLQFLGHSLWESKWGHRCDTGVTHSEKGCTCPKRFFTGGFFCGSTRAVPSGGFSLLMIWGFWGPGVQTS